VVRTGPASQSFTIDLITTQVAQSGQAPESCEIGRSGSPVTVARISYPGLLPDEIIDGSPAKSLVLSLERMSPGILCRSFNPLRGARIRPSRSVGLLVNGNRRIGEETEHVLHVRADQPDSSPATHLRQA
jgi:hypothetical protein